MLQYAIKTLLSAVLIVAISETAKRHSTLGGLLASLPLTSLLAFVWLYLDTGDGEKVAVLAQEILWLLLPSLALFLLLPWLIRQGWGFWWSLATACGGTALLYAAMLAVLRQLGR
jgi:hypothetical protein